MERIIQTVYDEYKDQLRKKASINNNRTSEGLMDYISSEYSTIDFENTNEEEALDRLRKAAFTYINEPLMYKLVRRFSNLPLPEEDRISAARIGFTIAMENFDPSLGYQFSTYAWRVISNEIIHANRLYLRPSSYQDVHRDILATTNGVVIDITKSINARRVVYRGKQVQLYDVVVRDGDQQHHYRYLYNLLVEVGDTIHPGMELGRRAGAIIDIGSTDAIIDDEERGDVQFTDYSTQGATPKSFLTYVMENDVREALLEGLNELSDLERKVIIDRFIVTPKVPRHRLSTELGMSEYRISRQEDIALEKLKKVLDRHNIHRRDLKI